MVSGKQKTFLLAVIIGLATTWISLGTLGTMSLALAQEPELEINVPVAQPPPPPPPDDSELQFIAFFTEEVSIQITDLSGNDIGEGRHGGEVRCNRNNCSQKTQLDFTPPLTRELVYKFTTRQALDAEAGRVVVGGTGAISSGGQKERFLFTATFQDNRDGTVEVRYEASRPDASFIIQRAPGRFEFRRR